MSLPRQILDSMRKQATNVLATGERFKRFDQVRQRHFWSMYRLYADPNGYIESGTFEFFQTPAGQQGQGFPFQLTPLETNWLGANRVPDNQNFNITEFGVSIRSVDLQNEVTPEGLNAVTYNNLSNYGFAENQILDNAILNITYLTNTIALGLATDFSQASGPWLGHYAPSMPQSYPIGSTINFPVQTSADYHRCLVSNGYPAPGLRRKLKIPILLQHGEAFRMNLTIDSGRGAFVSPPEAGVSVEEIQSFMAFDVRLEFWATESFVEKG